MNRLVVLEITRLLCQVKKVQNMGTVNHKRITDKERAAPKCKGEKLEEGVNFLDAKKQCRFMNHQSWRSKKDLTIKNSYRIQALERHEKVVMKMSQKLP